MEKPLLQVDSLSCRRGRNTVISNVSFELKKGDILGLLGPNGAGKSTIMRMLCGVLAPSHGQIGIAGHDMRLAPRLAKRYLGFLPEDPPLYADLTVDEYLRFCAALRGLGRSAIRAALSRSREICGLGDCGSRLIGNLSGGYRQRVGIAQAIIHQPELIVLDEPSAALDPLQMHQIHGLIGTLGEEHGIIMATHILSEVQEICNRVLILHRGRVVLDQPLEQLRAQASSRQRMEFDFASPPATTVLRGLQGVAEVRRLSDNRFLIEYRPGMDATETILGAALAQGWRPGRVAPEQEMLDTLFLRLIQGQESDTRTVSGRVE